MKKPVVAFTIADSSHMPMAKKMINSLRKFHSEEELPLIIYGDAEIAQVKDPALFYKATPLFARELIDQYDLVLKLDADQIITGKLDFIFTTKDYDIGTVLNINRVDPTQYGIVTVFDVPPNRYYNCGLVAMRSPAFVEHWYRLCNSYHFNNLQYREQDLLNIMCHYGDYLTRCFDIPDRVYNYYAWHGVVSKGEWNKAILKDKKIIIPKGKDNYPDHDMEVKLLHWAGGKDEKKMNYRTYFSEELITYLDYLISDEKPRTKT